MPSRSFCLAALAPLAFVIAFKKKGNSQSGEDNIRVSVDEVGSAAAEGITTNANRTVDETDVRREIPGFGRASWTTCEDWKAAEEPKGKVRIFCYDSKEALMNDHSWCKPTPNSGIPRNLQGLFWMKDCPLSEREVAFCASIGEFNGRELVTIPAHAFVFEDSAGGKLLFDKLYYNTINGSKEWFYHDPVKYLVKFQNDDNTLVTSETASVGGSMSLAVKGAGSLGYWWFVQRDTQGNVWDRLIDFGVMKVLYQAVRLYRLDADGNLDHDGLEASGCSVSDPSKPGFCKINSNLHEGGLDDKVKNALHKMLGQLEEMHEKRGYDGEQQGLSMVSAPCRGSPMAHCESTNIGDIQSLFLSDYPQPQADRTGQEPFGKKFFRVEYLG